LHNKKIKKYIRFNKTVKIQYLKIKQEVRVAETQIKFNIIKALMKLIFNQMHQGPKILI